MDVEAAVKTAIEYISEVFESEKPENIGLEEVVLNETSDEWEITIGFSRPWDYQEPGIVTRLQPQLPRRQLQGGYDRQQNRRS